MIQRASSVGELALRFLSGRDHGTVTRVFRRSAYLRAGSDFFLLLWDSGRSPMTVNVTAGRDCSQGLRVGEVCELSPSGIRARDLEVMAEGAPTYRSSLRARGPVALPGPGDLVKGAAMLRSLYDASPHGLSLVSDPAFLNFARNRLVPAARGTRELRFEDLLGLVGRGGGFTPAGDDFVAGFTSAFNYIARSRRSRPISIPRRRVVSKTIPESAAVMVYSSRGLVDEALVRLILDSLGGRCLSDELLRFA